MKKLMLFLLISFLMVACSKEENTFTELDQQIAQKLASAKTDDIIAYMNIDDNTSSSKISSNSTHYIKYKGKSAEGYTTLQVFYQKGDKKYSDPFYVTDAQRFITLPSDNTKYIEGKFIIWSENGNRLIEQNYENGFKEGKGIAWYENGNKIIEENYVRGKRTGLVTSWYENGQKSVEIHFINGREYGPSTSWYEDGQKQYEVFYKDGQLATVYKKWDKDGTELSLETIAEQIKSGTFKL